MRSSFIWTVAFVIAAVACARDLKEDTGLDTAVEDTSGEVGPTPPQPCEVDTDCDPTGECWVGVCDPETSRCVFELAPDPICCESDDDCDDGSGCSEDRCQENQCRFIKPDESCCEISLDCDDEDPCTIDRCDAGACEYESKGAGCCTRDADCDDSDTCTLDLCIDGRCGHAVDGSSSACACTSTVDCDDGNDCTMDACLNFTCDYNDVFSTGQPGPNCCRDERDCDDGKDYTIDTCKHFTCDHEYMKACFLDVHCHDDEYCTEDRCVDGFCTNAPKGIEGCCTEDIQCAVANPCVIGACKNHMCVQELASDPECCEADEDCDDGVPCTEDACRQNVCQHQATSEDCCSAHAQCDDANPCTLDQCASNLCTHSPLTECCETNADCDDQNPCTTETCTGDACLYDWAQGCCSDNSDCEDNDPCTLDSCTGQTCSYSEINDCCLHAGNCNDGNPCTVDTCVDNLCSFEQLPDCCQINADCFASDACHNASCQGGHCVESLIQSCCLDNSECDDGDDECSLDVCTNNKCEYKLIEAPGCCFVASDCDPPTVCDEPACVHKRCEFSHKEGCCLTDDECDDGDNFCTIDTCEANACAYELTGVPNCCLVPEDCVTADFCKSWSCADHQCASTEIPNCCHDDTECDDEDEICTTDHCVFGDCVFASTLQPDCCSVDADCDSVDVCEAGECGEDGSCSFTWIGGCCHTDEGCDDEDECTVDACLDHQCDYGPSGLPGCCEDWEWKEGFEGTAGMSGYPGWSFTNTGDFMNSTTWQVPDTTFGSPIKTHSGAGALYWGDSTSLLFGTPSYIGFMSMTPIAGAATGPTKALPEGQYPALRFWLFLDVEDAGNVDLFSVEIVVGSAATEVWDKSQLEPMDYKSWVQVEIDLAEYAGQNAKVRFKYDSVVTPSIPHEGIYIDDVTFIVDCGE